MKFLLKAFIASLTIGLLIAAASAQTKSSANIIQVVTASAPVAATVTLKSDLNPAAVNKVITYSGTVTGTNNGASPTGTITVAGITGSKTVTLGAGGAYTCTETPTTPTTGFKVIATYNGDQNFF